MAAFDQESSTSNLPHKGKRVTFDPTINLGHILTMLAVLGSVVSMYFSLDKRISKQEDMAPFVQSVRDEKDARVQQTLTVLSADLRDIKSSVDKLAVSVQVQSAMSSSKGTK